MTKGVDAVVRQLDKLSSERKRLHKRLGALNNKEDRLIGDLKRFSKAQKSTSLSCGEKKTKEKS